jgi:hypothetical protein
LPFASVRAILVILRREVNEPMTIEPLPGTVAVGFGATLVMDLWGALLSRVVGAPAPNYCLVGRWLAHMPAGTFAHPSIAGAPRKPAECALGWLAHYALGALYALVLVAFMSVRWLQAPTLSPALLFGLVSVGVPFLVMQPAFGLGIASSKAPDPMQARLRSLMNHAVFGIGLYLSARAIGPMIESPV